MTTLNITNTYEQVLTATQLTPNGWQFDVTLSLSPKVRGGWVALAGVPVSSVRQRGRLQSLQGVGS